MVSLTDNFSNTSSGFRALADPLRLQIIDLLRFREMCVCELCDELDVGQSKLSFHLKNLKDANLIISRQEGRWVYYRLNLSQFTVLERYLAAFNHGSEILPANDCERAITRDS